MNSFLHQFISWLRSDTNSRLTSDENNYLTNCPRCNYAKYSSYEWSAKCAQRDHGYSNHGHWPEIHKLNNE